MLKRSKMHSFVIIFKIGTPPISYTKVAKWYFLHWYLYKELVNSLYKYQWRKISFCYLRIRNGWDTYFKNYEERVYFWTFQHMNKKLWKYELLTPKTLEVRSWQPKQKFTFFDDLSGKNSSHLTDCSELTTSV